MAQECTFNLLKLPQGLQQRKEEWKERSGLENDFYIALILSACSLNDFGDLFLTHAQTKTCRATCGKSKVRDFLNFENHIVSLLYIYLLLLFTFTKTPLQSMLYFLFVYLPIFTIYLCICVTDQILPCSLTHSLSSPVAYSIFLLFQTMTSLLLSKEASSVVAQQKIGLLYCKVKMYIWSVLFSVQIADIV